MTDLWIIKIPNGYWAADSLESQRILREIIGKTIFSEEEYDAVEAAIGKYGYSLYEDIDSWDLETTENENE